MKPLLSRRGHLKSTWNGLFYCCTLVLKFHHPTCEKWPPKNFSIFTLKKVTWRTYLISFTVQYCFSISFCFYGACFTHLISSNLSCILCLWYYDQLVHFNKEITGNATYIVIVSGSILNVSTVHLNGIWHLISRYPSKPVLGGHPVLSGHSIPRGCPLSTGFTVPHFDYGDIIWGDQGNSIYLWMTCKCIRTKH